MARNSRDTAVRAKRFEVAERARKIASLEMMVIDFERVTIELARQISAEEERTGIRDASHVAYSTFAKAASLRRGNLVNSAAGLRAELDVAKREHRAAQAELRGSSQARSSTARNRLTTSVAPPDSCRSCCTVEVVWGVP